MKAFATLISSLENTTRTNDKIGYLKSYFLEADDRDKVWTIALFTHRRPRRQVNTRLLAEWAIGSSDLTPWLFEESYGVVGDLAETIALILPDSNEQSEKSLTQWITELIALQDKDESEKETYIKESWASLDPSERFIFNKLITGGFRLGVSHNLIFQALAQAYELERSQVAHRLSGDWDPAEISFEELLLSAEAHDPSKPYPFYLAYALEEDLSALGEPGEWLVEWKWDGIRSQLIKRNGELFLWSRGEELITAKFPEFDAIAERLPDGTVIDGELLAFAEGQPLEFAILQTRIGRKNVSKKHLREAPASIIAYDLLEWQGQDIRSKPMIERRAQLDELLKDPFLQPRLQLSKRVDFQSWGQLAELRKSSRDFNAEGFMLKRCESPYKSGRKRGDWWKWKVDPFTIDAVMIYAQKGHGRRADVYSDYTFAVWDGDQLVPFAKAYSGLTDLEIGEVTRFVQRHTLERFGPVRTVTPELVFEIHFEAINKSTRHKSGLAVRFPRIHRWRRDKKAEEANTLDDLKALIPTRN